MANFSVYGTIFNETYYDFPAPVAQDPDHGTWDTKPPSVKAGKSGYYHLADNAGCYGAEAAFYLSINQMDFKWAVLDGYSDDNYVRPYGMARAALTSFNAKSGDMTQWEVNTCPKKGHPVYVQHFVRHNPAYLLPVGTQQTQKRTFWCWATCISVLYAFYIKSGNSSALTQCNLATDFINKKYPGQNYDCCDFSDPVEVCDQPAPDATIESYLSAYGLQPGRSYRAPSFTDIKNACDNFTAVILGITWRGGVAGHVIIAHGYEVVDGVNYVQVMDPGTGTIRVSYDTLIGNYQGHGYVDMIITTAYPKPWTDREGENGKESSIIAGNNFQKETILRSISLPIAILPPTMEALTNPTKNYKVGRGQLREIPNPGNNTGILLEFVKFANDDPSIEEEIYSDQKFVSELWNTYLKARDFARLETTLHEVVYVPLPHLRVDAFAVFNPETLHQKAIFVIPRPYEKTLNLTDAIQPGEFWEEMRQRFRIILDRPAGLRG